jgi:hypothetical protein
MTSQLEALLCRICAWLYNAMRKLPFQPIGLDLVEHVLLRAAWNDGFLGACADLIDKQSCMLECLTRYKIVPTDKFHPWRPNLALITADTAHEWNMGYERAIMLYRLDYDPAMAWSCKLPLAVYGVLPCSFDAHVRCILDGELKAEPRRWSSITGQTLNALNGLEARLRSEYEDYATRIQQVRGYTSADVEKDLKKL